MTQHDYAAPLFLSTLLAGAGLDVAGSATVFLAPILFRAPMTLLLAGSFFAAGARLTIVVLALASLASLLLLGLPRRALGAGAGAATGFFGLPTADVPVFEAPAAARLDFAFSTMFVR